MPKLYEYFGLIAMFYANVVGCAPLEVNEMRFFQELVTAKADDIISKWIDFFVLNKSITPERISRRLK